MDPALIPTLGGTVGLLSVAGWLVISFMRESGTQRKERAEELAAVKKERAEEITLLKSDVRELKAENLTCRIQVDGLIAVLRNNGIAVPESLYRGTQ